MNLMLGKFLKTKSNPGKISYVKISDSEVDVDVDVDPVDPLAEPASVEPADPVASVEPVVPVALVDPVEVAVVNYEVELFCPSQIPQYK